MNNFNDNFPSLKDKVNDSNHFYPLGPYLAKSDVEKYCVDKQKIKEIALRLQTTDGKIFFRSLLDELGVE